MLRSVPAVEIADNTDSLSVGGPNGKRNSFHAVISDQVRAELLVYLFVPAFAKEVKIKFTERRRK